MDSALPLAARIQRFQIWNASHGKTLYTYHGHATEVRTLAWSPDSKYITSAEDSETGGGKVKVWVA
ncbi:MAG TPA: hypothetical protein VKV20_03340 [Ktedonobacteraceae bacterium]|nr:hypothetical protein [Ktedonobacteraceae bacterium]